MPRSIGASRLAPQGVAVAELGSHFVSKAMGARSQEPRAKIFAIGEIPELANARVRIPHPKIEELALQAQGVGIFVKDEYPSSKPISV